MLFGQYTYNPQKCFEKSDGYSRWDCLRPYFETLTQKMSASIALDEARNLVGQGAISDCHILAHSIGEANLKKYDFHMGEAFASCGSACIQGCQHGVMERYIRSKTDPYTVVSEIKSICEDVGPLRFTEIKDSYLTNQCNHGFGHGLLAHGLFTLKESALICKSLDERSMQIRCTSGVMMENMNQYSGMEEDYFRRILPTVCTSLEELNDELIMRNCKANIALGLMFYTGHNIERSQELCDELSQEDAAICKQDLVGPDMKQRTSKILEVPF